MAMPGLAEETEEVMAFDRPASRPRLTPSAAERHSRRVRKLRLVVPAAAAALLATYVVNATPPEVDREFLRQFAGVEASGREMLLDKPRYLGDGLDGVPFEVSAATARRNPLLPEVIRFDRPVALRDTGSGRQVRVTAESGVLDTETKLVALDRAVELVHGIGGQAFVLNTESAEIDMETQTVRSKASVRGRSETGDVEADRLTVYEADGRAILEGNARLVFEPAKARAAKTGLRD